MVTKAFTILIGLMFLAFGGFGSYLVVNNTQNANASKTWPVAKGLITASNVTEHINRHKGSADTISFWAEAEYKYSVKSKEYSGARITYDGTTFDKKDEAEAMLKQYPVGKSVDIHYDPGNPSNSVIQPGGNSSGNFPLIFTIPFALIGIIFLLFNIVKWSRNKPEQIEQIGTQ